MTALARAVAAARGPARWAMLVGAGGASALAMAPLSWWPVLLLSFPVLVWAIDGAGGWRRAAAAGWLFGFGYFLGGVWWVSEAFLVEAEVFAWLIPFVLILLPGGLALFTALGAGLAWALWCAGPLRAVSLAVGLGWAEWLRGWIFTGFPWNLYGYALIDTPLAQSMAFWGVYGLSLITVALAALPATLFDETPRRARMAAAGVALIVTSLLWLHGAKVLKAPAEEGGTLVRIVQPNVPQREKWLPENRVKVFQDLIALTTEDRGGDAPRLTVWPEAAAPFLLDRSDDALRLIAEAIGPDGVLLAGAPRIVRDEAGPGSTGRLHNSLHVIDGTGAVVARYDKHHLVPFGEYVPLERYLAPLGIAKLTAGRSAFSPGPGPQTLTLPNGERIGPLICYEAIFPGAVIAEGARPDWLLHITNDAWFGATAGPYQHLAAARARAIEEGVAVIRAANTGVSAVIDSRGRLLAKLELNTKGKIDVRVPSADAPTLFSQWKSRIYMVTLVLVSVVLRAFRARFFSSPMRRRAI